MSLLAISFAISLLAAGSGINDASAQAACNRDCLRTMLEQYLDAVIANDPAGAPLVVGFRQTENAVNTPVGRGVWQSVTGLGNVQRSYVDEVSGQAAFYGTVEEGDETAIVTVRVRVENRRLTEGEWYIARADDPGLGGPRQPGGPPANLHNPAYLEQNPPPERVVPRNVFSEWFVIDDAKIRTIYTSMFYPPPELPVPNWPPNTGNWPLPANIVPD